MKKITWLSLFFTLAANLSSLAQTSLYGVIRNGGTHNSGILFKTDINGNNRQVLANFGSASPTDEASEPWCSLMQASNGKLYGTSYIGGSAGKGTLFVFDLADSSLQTLFSFNGTSGENPVSTLVQASNGKIYGTTSGGGVNGQGTLFEYDYLNSTFIKKFDFDLSNSGSTPTGALVEINNKLYGVTNSGGLNSDGSLFEYDLTNSTFTVRHHFEYNTTGQGAQGTLCKANNGKLYGTSVSGGANLTGVLFEFDPTTYVTLPKHHFDAITDGGNPYASVIQASNGKLYGTAQAAGSNGQGTLYEYDLLLDTFQVKYAFANDSIGTNPLCPLMESSNGKLYGFSSFNYTTLFEYDFIADSISKKSYFSDAMAYGAILGGLIEATDYSAVNLTEQSMEQAIKVYPNPFTAQTTLLFGQALYDAHIVVSNQFGQTVHEIYQSASTSLIFERDNLPAGIYFLEVSAKNFEVQHLRIVISNN